MAASKPPVPDSGAALAASVRALRAALASLASQYGFRRDSQNAVLLALGASPADLETMRVFLNAHPAGGSEDPA